MRQMEPLDAKVIHGRLSVDDAFSALQSRNYFLLKRFYESMVSIRLLSSSSRRLSCLA
jgi:hypothetical protein